MRRLFSKREKYGDVKECRRKEGWEHGENRGGWGMESWRKEQKITQKGLIFRNLRMAKARKPRKEGPELKKSGVGGGRLGPPPSPSTGGHVRMLTCEY